MVIVTIRTQSLPLVRRKAGDFGQKYAVLTKLIIRILNCVQISELLDLEREDSIIIFKTNLEKMLQKFPHWTAPGKDGLQGYWRKSFKSLHDQLLNFPYLVKFQTGWFGARLYLFRKTLVKVKSQAIIDPLHLC